MARPDSQRKLIVPRYRLNSLFVGVLLSRVRRRGIHCRQSRWRSVLILLSSVLLSYSVVCHCLWPSTESQRFQSQLTIQKYCKILTRCTFSTIELFWECYINWHFTNLLTYLRSNCNAESIVTVENILNQRRSHEFVLKTMLPTSYEVVERCKLPHRKCIKSPENAPSDCKYRLV